MYLGIDFVLTPGLEPLVVEANIGLPGGATEYDRAYLSVYGRSSAIFERIESIAEQKWYLPFRGYLASLPFLAALKSLKLWMDGQGPFPKRFHPAFRLEDKWVQYQVLRGLVPMPETRPLGPETLEDAERWLAERRALASKLRTGRGGRGFLVVEDPEKLRELAVEAKPRLVQEFVDSRIEGYTLSIRAAVFAGEFLGAYANLARRPNSNHGIIALVEEGPEFGLENPYFRTQTFDERSWEAELWFGPENPEYLRRNLYEDEAADSPLNLPAALFGRIKDLSVRLERFLDRLDWSALPAAWFEDHRPEAL